MKNEHGESGRKMRGKKPFPILGEESQARGETKPYAHWLNATDERETLSFTWRFMLRLHLYD